MRLWSIHPRYLDSVGLVALWREGLLAKKVLQGRTRGYRRHPQLHRFNMQGSPVGSMNRYLKAVWLESVRRGFSFDKDKLGGGRTVRRIPVTDGQLRFELRHLRRKLRERNRKHLASVVNVRTPVPHPLFKIRRGAVEDWERP
jgi:hypothetical protein